MSFAGAKLPALPLWQSLGPLKENKEVAGDNLTVSPDFWSCCKDVGNPPLCIGAGFSKLKQDLALSPGPQPTAASFTGHNHVTAIP